MIKFSKTLVTNYLTLNTKNWFPLLLLILVGLSSCSKKAEKSLEDQLVRYWNISPTMENVDSNQFIELKKTKEAKDFQFYAGSDTLAGNWELSEDNFLVLNTPIKGVNTQIDSVVHEYDIDGNPKVNFYSEGQIINSLGDGKLNQDFASISFKLRDVTNDKLVLESPKSKKLYVFDYKPTIISSSISFYSITRGLIGLAVLLFIAYLLSSNRKSINWSLVIKGLSIQLVLAISVLYVPFVATFFDALSSGFIKLIGFTDKGTEFVFGSFVTNNVEAGLINFAFKVLPTIIFFSALMSLFYYLGIIQYIVYAFAWVMKKTMRLSGAESLAAAGNIFMGQTESPLLIKPYLDKMTKSELMCLMTGGMATIAGGVLAAYIGFLGGGDPVEEAFFAKHLLTASILSAPAAVVAAKMLVPETDKYNTEMKIPKDKIGSNVLEAITNGTTDGLKLAVNVGAMLLVFTALMYFLNWLLAKFGYYTGLNEIIADHTAYNGLSFQFILGYTFAPVAGLLGVDNWNDMRLMGQLLGEKTILNEFYAYKTLGEMKAGGLFQSRKAVVMSTYMLCGFANFASIGIQIGGIGALVPNRKGLLSSLGVKALIGGTLACLFTAVVVGMLM
mgnify:CR=1 FL=1